MGAQSEEFWAFFWHFALISKLTSFKPWHAWTCLRLCYTRQSFLQLVSQFHCTVATWCPNRCWCNMPWNEHVSHNVFVAVTVARSRTDFCFSQRLQLQKNCETYSFQSMLHLTTIHTTCVATKLQDKLQEKNPSVTASLVLESCLLAFHQAQFSLYLLFKAANSLMIPLHCSSFANASLKKPQIYHVSMCQIMWSPCENCVVIGCS